MRTETVIYSSAHGKQAMQSGMFVYVGLDAMIENRNGLVVQGDVRKPVGEGGETGAALKMLGDHGGENEITLGADKGYDAIELVAALKLNGVIPHIARNQYEGLVGGGGQAHGFAEFLRGVDVVHSALDGLVCNTARLVEWDRTTEIGSPPDPVVDTHSEKHSGIVIRID